MEKDNSFTTFLTNNAEHYVRTFLNDNLSDDIYYHDVEHTVDVVKASEIIGRDCKLTDDQLETVIVAAWFHDTGYCKGEENHEKASAEIAREFLNSQEVPEKKIDDVLGCIAATRMPQAPTNIMEKVICDADLYHLSTDKFFEKTELLRKELVAHKMIKEKENWLAKSLDFVCAHSYFTQFAKKILKPQKKANIVKLRKIIAEKSSKG